MEKNGNHRKAKCVAVFGTGSDVGKSVVVAALCRIFSDLGVRVAPFKAQNMSNNSYVTPEGGEMGRAQIVQAEAAHIAPHVDMNPVLLKPSTDTGSQVVLYGQPLGNKEAKDISPTQITFTKSQWLLCSVSGHPTLSSSWRARVPAPKSICATGIL